MSTRRTIVFGAGKRVREAALPALERAEDFEVAFIVARSARTLEVDGKSYEVRAIDSLSQSDLDGIGMISTAVTKDAVPPVLARLAALDVSNIDLLVDTPVVRFRHFGHSKKLDAFRNAWVAEDCTELPWIDTVRAALDKGLIGELREVRFFRSAYAYHGVATAKTLLGSPIVKSARRRPAPDGLFERELRFANGKRATIVEPRDYSIGHVELQGTHGTISDSRGANHHLEPIVEEGLVRGFRIGDVETRLTESEAGLTAGDADGASVIARMEAMKRVGFLRLLDRIAAGKGAYPARAGLDDMVVDYHLEKAGRYLANPFTSVGSPLARVLLGLVSRLGG